MATARQTAAEKREEAAQEDATQEDTPDNVAAKENAAAQEVAEKEIAKDPNRARVGSSVVHTAEDHLGINRIVGFSDTNWEPAQVEPTEAELAHAAELVEAGVVPAPEKAEASDEPDS